MFINNDMASFINIAKQGNPQQVVMNMLQQRVQQGNPIFANLLDKVQQGDTRGVETIVRNMAQEKGIDFDKEFNSFRRQFGL